MHDFIVALCGTIAPTVAIIIVGMNNNVKFKGINQRFDAVNQRFDDMRELWRAELRRVEEVLDARLKHIEDRN